MQRVADLMIVCTWKQPRSELLRYDFRSLYTKGPGLLITTPTNIIFHHYVSRRKKNQYMFLFSKFGSDLYLTSWSVLSADKTIWGTVPATWIRWAIKWGTKITLWVRIDLLHWFQIISYLTKSLTERKILFSFVVPCFINKSYSRIT